MHIFQIMGYMWSFSLKCSIKSSVEYTLAGLQPIPCKLMSWISNRPSLNRNLMSTYKLINPWWRIWWALLGIDYLYIFVRSAFWSEAIDKLGLLRPGQSILMYWRFVFNVKNIHCKQYETILSVESFCCYFMENSNAFIYNMIWFGQK